jgi:zinc protease
MPRAIAALLFLTAALRAQPKLEFEHYQLPNGIEVILHVDRKAPLVHLNLRFRVGSKHEAPGRTGFAHLFEHLMYENGDASIAFNAVAEAIGATGVNAFTHMDYTDYCGTVPASRLERMLWMESNNIAGLPRNLTQERFEKEREIVINERRQRIENEPYAVGPTLFLQHVFPPGHPYTHDPLGSAADLMAASLDDVRAFYRDYYTSDNLSIAVTGDFDPAQAKQWIAKYFGSMAPGPGSVSPAIFVPQLTAPKLVDVSAHVPYPKIVFAWPAPGASDPDSTALEFAEFLLTDSWKQRNAALAGICCDAAAGYYQFQDASVFTVNATVENKHTAAEVEAVLAAEMARFAQDGPTGQDLERARNKLQFEQLSSLEELDNVASTLNQVQHFYGGVEHFNDWATRYSKVTAEAVRKAVSRWLVTPNRLAIRFTPISAHRGETPEPDRNSPPPFQPEKPFHPPEVKSAKLPNGLQIFVVERHELPKVSVTLRFNLGSAHDPPGKPGVALLAMATDDCGTTTRTASEIENEKSRLAADFSGDADSNSQDGRFEVLRKNFDPTFQLFADQLLHPIYPRDVFEKHRNDILAGMEDSAGRIDDYASFAMAVAFGPKHPLGATAAKPESLRSIAVGDIVEFQKRYWRPDAAVLVFAGDLTLEEAVAAATKYLGEWTGTAGQPQALPPPEPMPGRTFLVDRKGATQTMVALVLPGIPRTHPDFPALVLADRVWGGGGFSRLYRDIRMDKGIAYTTGSELWSLPGYGLWIAHSPVQADRTLEAMAALTQEVRDLAGQRPITQEEFAAAQQGIVREYPGNFEVASSVADRISQTWAFGLPLSDLETWPQRVASLTLEEVNAAARKYARPDKAVFVLVGDREKIGPIEGAVAIQ